MRPSPRRGRDMRADVRAGCRVNAVAPPAAPAAPSRRGCRARLVAAACALLVACGDVCSATFTFNVNSTDDTLDANPGDGICETAPANGVCTLRAALQEANARFGPDVIDLQAGATYLLTRTQGADPLTSGDLDVVDSVTIAVSGQGRAIIDGNAVDGVLSIHACIGDAQGCGFGTVEADISGVTIRGGLRSNRGGGIYNAGDLTLAYSEVSGNDCLGGGGIANDGQLTVSNSTIGDNLVEGVGGEGGGIMNLGQATIVDSTISGNHAPVGGGIFNGGTLDVVQSTISGNSSDVGGGGIYSGGTTGLYNVTIVGNIANADKSSETAYGGGVYNYPGATVNLANSILTGNSHLTDTLFGVLDDCSGTISAQGHNIVTYAANCNIVGSYSPAKPLLGPLQFNGGPTKTQALLAGSFGIDAGDGCTDQHGATLTTDQRGLPRPVGMACDLGAYELQPDPIFADGFEGPA